MNNKNICIGLGTGLVLIGVGAMVMHPKKKCRVKKAVGKAMLALGEVVDTVSGALGL